MSEKKPCIEGQKNGPLRVINMERIENSKGEKIAADPPVLLCRCGESQSKPFCDGSHVKNGYTDEKSPDRRPERIRSYPGKTIIIHDNRCVCAHRGHCTDSLPAVFRLGERPWIDPDGAPPDEIARVIEMCPSGALSYSRHDEMHKNWKTEKKVIVTRDGPYDVEGGIEFRDERCNHPETTDHYTLCRCGASENKPFCNGRHWDISFKDPKN